jgi:pimeloyl-ACP methyl ester carboxylesterase
VTGTDSIISDGLDQKKLRFIDIDGVRTRYYDDGTGEPLVLLSGGNFGSLYSLDSFSLNLPGLARDFRVIAIDKPGQGHTAPPVKDEDFTHDGLVNHTAGLLRALGIDQAHFVGHSRGGLHISWLAIRHPELVKSLVLVDSRSTAPDHPDYPLGAFYAGLPQPPPGPPSRESVGIEPRGQAYHQEQVTDDFLDRLVEIANLPQFQEAQRRIAAVNDSIWRPDLLRTRDETLRFLDERGFRAPTLLIWAMNDKSAPLMLGIQLFERICAKTAQPEMHVLNGAGHYCFRDQTEAFNRTVRSFCLR